MILRGFSKKENWYRLKQPCQLRRCLPLLSDYKPIGSRIENILNRTIENVKWKAGAEFLHRERPLSTVSSIHQNSKSKVNGWIRVVTGVTS